MIYDFLQRSLKILISWNNDELVKSVLCHFFHYSSSYCHIDSCLCFTWLKSTTFEASNISLNFKIVKSVTKIRIHSFVFFVRRICCNCVCEFLSNNFFKFFKNFTKNFFSINTDLRVEIFSNSSRASRSFNKIVDDRLSNSN